MWRPRVFADYYVAVLALAWLAAVADIREGRPVVLVAAILITILMCLAKTATVVTITPERVATYALFVRRGRFAPADVRIELAHGQFVSAARVVACDDGRTLARLGGMLGARPVNRLRRRAVDAGVNVVDVPWRSRSRLDGDLALSLFAAVLLVTAAAR